MKVYFIRHGQTNYNLQRIHQGWGNSSLTPLGEEQARKTKELIQDIKFDKIYSSDLHRARQTGNIIFPEREDIIFDKRLREVNNTCFEGQSYDSVRAKYGPEHDTRTANYDYSFYGGESNSHLRERVTDFLKELEDLAKNNKNIRRVAVIAHGGVIQTVNCIIHGIAPSSQTVKVDNASVNIIRYADGRWKIHAWNYTGNID